MTPREKLQIALRYLDEANDGVTEAAGHSDPYTRTARRQELKSNLEAARELLAELEREHPDATAVRICDDGSEAIVDVARVRCMAYSVEADVMVRCYEDYAAARTIIERTIAILSDVADQHALLGMVCAQAQDFPAAFAAMERAISLDPDNIQFKHVLNEIRREEERVAAEAAASAKSSRWNIRSWLG
jgi:tetratricopeptide (TPR) repeat protein